MKDEAPQQVDLLKTGVLQTAILSSANFPILATDAKGVIQIFNVGAERMLGYSHADVVNKMTLADIADPQEVICRARALSAELGVAIAPGFDALVLKAARGIEDTYKLTYIREDGRRVPALVSVTVLRGAENTIIGYLLLATDNPAGSRAYPVRAQHPRGQPRPAGHHQRRRQDHRRQLELDQGHRSGQIRADRHRFF
jgi:PAS domain-containing protein